MKQIETEEGNRLIAEFNTLEVAISELNLDRRHKWEVFEGKVCHPAKISLPCSGCSCDCGDGYGCNHEPAGCRECGGSGKRRMIFPVFAMVGHEIVTVKSHHQNK